MGVVKSVDAPAPAPCQGPLGSLSPDTRPVTSLLSSTQGKAEVKPGGPQTEPCGYFKMCLLRTVQGVFVQHLGLLSVFFKSAEGQGWLQKPRGLSSSKFWVTAHLARGLLSSGSRSRFQELVVSALVEIVGGRSAVSAVMGELEEPRVFLVSGAAGSP